MAKSARSSAVKKNNQRLKQKVFGPVETARNERLNAKLLELVAQSKPEKSDMDIEREGTNMLLPAAKDITDDLIAVAEVEDDPPAPKGVFPSPEPLRVHLIYTLRSVLVV